MTNRNTTQRDTAISKEKSHAAAEQDRLNARMQLEGVLEFALHKALHAEPATPVQVEAFLATAPPEVFVLLDGLIAPPSPSGFRDSSLHTDRIVQGFVGSILAQKGSRQRTVRTNGGVQGDD